MTPRMRDALTEARRGPLRRVFDDTPGKPRWPAPAVTLHALVRHGLLELRERRTRKGRKLQEWRITKAGRAALEPVHRPGRDTVTRLHSRARGSTLIMQGGEWVELRIPEPEQVADAITAGFAAAVHLADARATAGRRARDLQCRARTLRRRLAMGEFRNEQQRRQVVAQLADVEAELRAAMVVGRLAA